MVILRRLVRFVLENDWSWGEEPNFPGQMNTKPPLTPLITLFSRNLIAQLAHISLQWNNGIRIKYISTFISRSLAI